MKVLLLAESLASDMPKTYALKLLSWLQKFGPGIFVPYTKKSSLRGQFLKYGVPFQGVLTKSKLHGADGVATLKKIYCRLKAGSLLMPRPVGFASKEAII